MFCFHAADAAGLNLFRGTASHRSPHRWCSERVHMLGVVRRRTRAWPRANLFVGAWPSTRTVEAAHGSRGSFRFVLWFLQAPTALSEAVHLCTSPPSCLSVGLDCWWASYASSLLVCSRSSAVSVCRRLRSVTVADSHGRDDVQQTEEAADELSTLGRDLSWSGGGRLVG